MIFVTLFNTNSSEITVSDFNLQLFLIISLTLVIIEVIAIIIIKYNDYIAAGLVIGITAGTFNALQTISKRITAIPDPTLTLLFTGATFLTATLTMLIQQFAFTKSKANVTIPCYTSASIIIAVIIGLVALSEDIVLIQIFGIGLLILGVICVSAFNKEQPTED